MKKTLLLLISFLIFITFTNASETVGCTIQKETNNLIDYKKGDIVEVNVVTDFYSEFGTLDKAKIQLYYNPYVFELLSDYNDESVYIEEGYKISEFNTYSSIINFEIKNVTGKNMLVNGGDILISKLKFKVKEDASLGQTTIELIDNSEFYIKGSSESFNCFNSKLIYNITDTPSNKIDSTLSFIKDKSSYLIGKYNPNTTTYQIDTYNSELKLDTYCSSSECSTEISGCADSVCKFKEGQNKITITNTVEDSKTTYTLNINYIKESDVEYKFPNLKKLSVENFKFLEEFNPDTFNYHLVVPSTVDSLLIDYDADNDVTVEIIGNENFKTGENIVRIKTKNESDEANYYIVVTKSEKEEDSKIPVIDKEEEKPQEEVKKVNNKYILIGLFSIVIVLGYILYDTFYTKKEKEIKEENITNNEEVNDKEENEVNKTDDEE